MRPSRLRHRIQATVAVVGTVAAVFGISRAIKAVAHPPAPAPVAVTYTPPVYTPPIIPRTLPAVERPPVVAMSTAALDDAAAEGDVGKMEAAYREGMPLENAMLAAAEADKPKAVEWLIAKGATADDAGVVLAADKAPAVLKVLFAKGAKDVTLHAAADAGAINAVNRALAKGADPNAAGDDGQTPFMIAVTKGDVHSVRAMIAHGAKVDETHLEAAMTETDSGDLPVLDTLLGARISPTAAARALDAAFAETGARVVKKLATKGIAWSWRDEQGDHHVPLVDAVERGDVAVVRAMLDAGAPVNQGTEFGKTPLAAALSASAGTDDGVRLVRLLLARGADPNRRLETGDRPLAKAAATGDIRIVTMLLDHGASINAGLASSDDETALEAAENAGHTEIARVLRARGARRRPVQD